MQCGLQWSSVPADDKGLASSAGWLISRSAYLLNIEVSTWWHWVQPVCCMLLWLPTPSLQLQASSAHSLRSVCLSPTARCTSHAQRALTVRTSKKGLSIVLSGPWNTSHTVPRCGAEHSDRHIMHTCKWNEKSIISHLTSRLKTFTWLCTSHSFFLFFSPAMINKW